MLPLWGNLAVSWPGQEPPFPSRRTWACDCPQVGGGSCIGGKATRDSRQFFWNPPDSDQALAEERVLAQEPGGWVRGLGPPLVPCAGLLPDLPPPPPTAGPGVPLGRLQGLVPPDVLFGGPRARPPPEAFWCRYPGQGCRAHLTGRLSVISPHVKHPPTPAPDPSCCQPAMRFIHSSFHSKNLN